MADYPFVPKSNASLTPGQFWTIPLSDGRFACGLVLAIDREARSGAKTMFVGGILDWVGDAPPTAAAIAGRRVREIGKSHVRVIAESGGAIVGEHPLEPDAIVDPATISSYWGMRYPALRTEQLFVTGAPPPGEDFREVRSPLTGEMLRPSSSGRGVVQFNRLLTDDDFAQVADWMRQYPEMSLRAYGSYDGSIRDLEFLRFFPFLRRFAVDAVHDSLESLDGLRHLPPDAEELSIGWTKRSLDLAVLDRFRDLRTLYLEGQRKNIATISRLTALDDLTLRSITLPDLSVLVPLTSLRSLDLKLGGTSDLALLPRIGRLRYLELWMIKGLTDISAVGELPDLRYLFLQALKQVDRLPDLSRCTSLRRIHLETMKGIDDLRPLTTAPALEEVVLQDMGHLQHGDLAPLVGLPRLRAVAYGLGSFRKRDAARALVGLPEVEHTFDWRQD